jgi:hypothetical protein
MSRKPSAPASSGRAQQAGREKQDEQREPGERFGPLVVARQAKEDGRALLLYARAQRESR